MPLNFSCSYLAESYFQSSSVLSVSLLSQKPSFPIPFVSAGVVITVLVLVVGAGAWLLAPAVSQQTKELSESLPASIDCFKSILSQSSGGRELLIGLAVLGVPFAIVLRILAGLLNFVPYLAVAPARLVAFPQSSTLALDVFVLYVGIQSLEGLTALTR